MLQVPFPRFFVQQKKNEMDMDMAGIIKLPIAYLGRIKLDANVAGNFGGISRK